MTRKYWITALTFGLPWSISMIIYNLMTEDGPALIIVLSTVIGGLIAGLLFASIMHYAAKRLIKTIIIDTADNENIIKEGPANHFKGKEGVGGKLVLTEKRLIFKSHKLNIQNHQDNFDLEQVEKLEAAKTFRLLENRIHLMLSNKEMHKFIVDEPKDWIEQIANQKRLNN